MSSPDHNALLDQLQAQVNLVLEQTGRVFAAMASTPKVPPVAQITKLQHLLPVASNRFHQALDKLENELQLAALVMRRDLAVCRERSSAGGDASVTTSSGSSSAQTKPVGVGSSEKEALEETDKPPQDDIAMHDASQDTTSETTSPQEKPESPDAKADPTPVIESAAATSPKDAKRSLQEAKPDAAAELLFGQSEEQSDPSNGGLHIETQQESKDDHQPAEEKAPDTATGDLDSLFNDPISAEDATATDAFNFDQNNSNELDFSAFGTSFDTTGADNDNISSLLPGLEDYANTQTNTAADVMDFDSFFSAAADGQNNGMGNQDSGEQRDTTFDDLMDLANFEALDSNENNNNGNNNNTELDFDNLFN